MKKKIILSYGSYAGLLLAVFLVLTVVLFPKEAYDPQIGMLIGYTGMLLGFSFILLGVKNARTFTTQKWNFGRAFLTGLGIMAIACIFYTLAWQIYMYGFDPEWIQKYMAMEVERINSSGLPPEEISEKISEMEKWEEISKNPFVFGLFVYMEPFPPGIFMSLVAAFIWRKKA